MHVLKQQKEKQTNANNSVRLQMKIFPFKAVYTTESKIIFLVFN
jgi:hypothetical protein